MFQKSMVVLVCICLAALMLVGFALVSKADAQTGSKVTFEWDTNDEPDLAGYRLWQTTTSGDYIVDDIANHPPAAEILLSNPAFDHTGDTCQFTIENIPDGTYFWVLTAHDDETPENQSGISNEVTADLDATAPAPPGGLLISAIDKMIASLQLDKRADTKRIAALRDLKKYVMATMPTQPSQVKGTHLKFN